MNNTLTSKFNLKAYLLFPTVITFPIPLIQILSGDGLSPDLPLHVSILFKLFLISIYILVLYSVLNLLIVIKIVDNTIHLRNIITRKEYSIKPDDLKQIKHSAISDIIKIKSTTKTHYLYATYYKKKHHLIQSLIQLNEIKTSK